MRHGPNANFEYEQQSCDYFLIVPFSAGVEGTPITPHAWRISAYECRGSILPLGKFHCAEFFIAPPEFGWTMVHTHEDHALGGPYFLRQDWVV